MSNPARGFYEGDDWKGANSQGGGALPVFLVVGLIAGVVILTGRRQPASLPEDLPGVISMRERPRDHAHSAQLVRASLLLHEGRLAEAEAIYAELIERDPEDPDAHESLGACLYFRADYAAAEASYRRALELAPDRPDALYGLGCVHLAQRRHADAKRALERALELGHDRALTCWSLGLLADESEETEAAVRHFRAYLAADPDDEDHVAHARRRLEELAQ